MTVTGVDFVTIPTQDLDAAVEFYGTTLGLERSVYRPERNFAEFETGSVTLSVVVAEKMGFDFAPTRNPLALPDGNAFMLHHRYAPRG
jgi:catechol 2,3-dioxygenase-like lactoylglutathione lyase family enzyme